MNEEIQKYSEYCLNCPTKPCSQNGCPLNNDIPAFIKQIKEGNIEEAYRILSKTTILGSICGRICPHMKQCQGSCIRGIKGEPVQIGKLEAYVFDEALKNGWYRNIEKTDELKGKKVAVIGGGPAGLTCSSFLARSGAEVTIYEKYGKLGGILEHGIPEFRLEKDILEKTIEAILSIGIKVEYNRELGKNLDLKELEKEYDAIFLSFGANIPSKMNIEGEDLEGVYGGNSLLEYGNHPSYKGKKVAVIGGGNVAMDCSRTIKRLGADKVYVIYRRAEKQMPAEVKEIEEAKQEGVEFLFQNNIVKIIGKKDIIKKEDAEKAEIQKNIEATDRVEKIECIRTKLVKKEGETREVPINIEGSNYEMDMDYVVMAVGSSPEKELLEKLEQSGIELNKWGYIQVDENHRTSNEKVFAGGDLAGDKSTVAWAARAGRDVAESLQRRHF